MSKADLQAALAKTAGSTRRTIPEGNPRPEAPPTGEGYKQPSRANTKPITGHFPKEVRDELNPHFPDGMVCS
jgi:hypothetical protein